MAKKIITFRVSPEEEQKLQLLETTIKNSMGNDLSRSSIINEIINVAYDKIFSNEIAAPSEENSNFLLEEIDSIADKKLNEGLLKFNEMNKQEYPAFDIELVLTELLEDVELILKLLPYSKEYRNEDQSEKSREILSLVQSKSMFRKYTQAKSKNIIENRRKEK